LCTSVSRLALPWNKQIFKEKGLTLPCEQDWLEIRLEAPADRLGLTGLACGSRFQAQLAAFNRVGLGAPSTVLHFSTAGAGKDSFLLVNTI
jgi:hypothetical protein